LFQTATKKRVGKKCFPYATNIVIEKTGHEVICFIAKEESRMIVIQKIMLKFVENLRNGHDKMQ